MQEISPAPSPPRRRRLRRWALRARRILTGRRVRPFWLHCLLAFPLATVPSWALLLLGAAVLGAFGIEMPREVPFNIELTVRELFLTDVVWPLVETLLLALGMIVLCSIIKRPVLAGAVSALLWGVLHGLVAPFWFVGVTWPFSFFPCAFWRGGRFHFGAASRRPSFPMRLTTGSSPS